MNDVQHYFTAGDVDAPRHEVRATIWDREFTFTSARGVFSAHRLDLGTSVLLTRVDPPPSASCLRLLDLGCGFGPIATALAVSVPTAAVDAVDVNPLACALTRENVERHGVCDRVTVGSPEELPVAQYDEIWSNPPIRIGKDALHQMLLTWLPRLKPDGCAWLVVSKNLGGDSLMNWLTDNNWPTQKYASAKGFRILKVERT